LGYDKGRPDTGVIVESRAFVTIIGHAVPVRIDTIVASEADVAVIRYGVPVRVQPVVKPRAQIAGIGNPVPVCIWLALIRNEVSVAVLAYSLLDVYIIKDSVPVAVSSTAVQLLIADLRGLTGKRPGLTGSLPITPFRPVTEQGIRARGPIGCVVG
jgi:hypothetical protein